MSLDELSKGKTIAASSFGALKISEDGLISFYQNGNHVWDM